MAKRAATSRRPPVADAEVPVVGMREPCPCGSGKRYKVCHGKQAHRAATAATAAPVRPFAGLPGEVDWVALREIVSAATTPLRLADGPSDRPATLVSLLPMGVPALTRSDGTIWLAAQTLSSTSGDPSRDMAYALELALEADPAVGRTIEPQTVPDGARLQDVVDLSAPLEVEVHDSFDYWIGEGADSDPAVAASLERANEAVVPTARVAGVDGAYWCRLADRDQVRWVMPYDEEPLLDALARLHARAEDSVGDGTRLLGTFRAHGLLIPVWDLVPGTTAEEVAAPAAAFAERLHLALAETGPLTAAERGARAGLTNRQVTVR